MNEINSSKNILVLIGSPRRNGNSAKLAESVAKGARDSDSCVTVHFIDDYISCFLKDCRICRQSDGECSINDRFRTLFLEAFLPADGVVFCSPVYWYGLSAQMKAFFDRTFCFYATTYPDSAKVISRMSRKRIGLVLSSEETYPGAGLGIVHQLQEFSRYTRSEFVGLVSGAGNSRGEIVNDPRDPLAAAKLLGKQLFIRKYTDLRLDSARSGQVWADSKTGSQI